MLIIVLLCSLSLLAQSPDLFQAIRNNDLATLRKANKDELAARDRRGATLLMHAAPFGSIDAVKLLLDAGADVNARSGTESTALLWAACDHAKARLLVERGADVNAVSKMGRNPLIAAASCPGNLATVKLLLDKGANPNTAGPDGVSPITAAASNGDFAIVEALMARGADPKSRDKTGITTLQSAATWLNVPAVKMLLAKGVDVNAANTDSGTVKNGKIQLTNLTPLLLAAPFGSPDLMKPLLAAGANVNAADGRGMTPLASAVATERQNTASIQLLIKAGANLNAKNLMGQTPLDWANLIGNPAVIAMLKKAGAKPGNPHQPPSRDSSSTPTALEAVNRSIPLIQRVNSKYFENSGCAGCHHQMIAQVMFQQARNASLNHNRQAAAQTSREVYGQFQQFTEIMLQRMDLPTIDIPLYGLFGLAADGQKPDLITDTVIATIASLQQSDGGWSNYGITRPPIDESNIQRAALGLRVLQQFPIPARLSEFDSRITKAKFYIERAKPVTNDDYIWRAIGLKWAKSSAAFVAAQQLLKRQLPDGGWAQNQWSASDAYATGEALWALRETGALQPDSPDYRRGAKLLLSTQFPDGSWYVRSRAPKFQPYFESGFPYSHDQWISAAATSWAVAALAPLAVSTAASPAQ
ncbi:MAG: ankyrin repeat domain-containing protein [Acidobacteria bacterium]|nr:ankyrin repeat domain-containing protein [Acidobacteriota bacterium]